MHQHYFLLLECIHPKKTILMDFSLFLQVKYFNCFLWKKYQYITSQTLMHNPDATNPYIGNIGEEKNRRNISVLSFCWLRQMTKFWISTKIVTMSWFVRTTPKQLYVFRVAELVIPSAENLMTQYTVSFVCQHCQT